LVLLDCAHNPDGAEALREAIERQKRRKLILVLGIMKDKDIAGIIAPLAPLADVVITAAPDMPRSADPEVLSGMISAVGVEVISRPTVKEACKEALARARAEDMVCITGSIFTVGEARTYFKRRGA
jgi:dihydrofolate synthase/folylpolyglutamate synthase